MVRAGAAKLGEASDDKLSPYALAWVDNSRAPCDRDCIGACTRYPGEGRESKAADHGFGDMESKGSRSCGSSPRGGAAGTVRAKCNFALPMCQNNQGRSHGVPVGRADNPRWGLGRIPWLTSRRCPSRRETDARVMTFLGRSRSGGILRSWSRAKWRVRPFRTIRLRPNAQL